MTNQFHSLKRSLMKKKGREREKRLAMNRTKRSSLVPDNAIATSTSVFNSWMTPLTPSSPLCAKPQRAGRPKNAYYLHVHI